MAYARAIDVAEKTPFRQVKVSTRSPKTRVDTYSQVSWSDVRAVCLKPAGQRKQDGMQASPDELWSPHRGGDVDTGAARA
jgi:hypothetical protein